MERAESPSPSKISESDAMSGDYPQIGVRQFGRFNWLGLWTLYLKEVRRFTKVWMQTLMAPIVTTLLFLAIFSLALAGLRPDINGVPFINFLAPGLIMMSIVQNAFANSSSSLLVAKVQGNVVDFLMPPLSPLELNIGITFGGLTRGLFVGFGTFTAMSFFVDFTVHSFVVALFYAAVASLLLGQMQHTGAFFRAQNRLGDHLIFDIVKFARAKARAA